MANIVTCDCKPLARIFSYGDSLPVDGVDLRRSVEAREFYGDQTIEDQDFPYCTSIGDSAYQNSSIKNLSVPSCTYIGKNAFQGSTIRGGDFSSVLKVDKEAFYQCWVLGPGELDFQACKEIGANAFRSERRASGEGYPDLKIRDVITIGDSAFYDTGLIGAKNVRKLYLPYCEYIGDFGLGNATSGWQNKCTSIELPSIREVGEQAFRGMIVSEHIIKFGPNLEKIGNTCFWDIIVGQSLYIEATTPPELAGRFSWLGDKPAHIYVPEGSKEEYQAAENWSDYADVISALPDDYEPIYPPH